MVQIDMVERQSRVPAACAARAPCISPSRANKSGHAGRRDRDRQRELLAEQRGRDRDLRDVDQHALAQLDGVEVGAVGGERQLVIGAALAVVEQRARQAPPRDLAQVLDIGDGAHVVTMLT